MYDVLIISVVTNSSRRLPASLNLNHKPTLLTHPREGYFYFKLIDRYVPNEHKALVDQATKELIDFSKPHGAITSYEKGCTGPLCMRANRVYRRVLKSRKSDKPNLQYLFKPHYHAVEPLLALLTEYANQIAHLQHSQ